MLVLITRPLKEAESLAAILKSRGVECLIEPLLSIKPAQGGVPTLDGVQALLFTSANGVDSFALQSSRRDLPVFAVGEQTAEAASAAGFTTIESARGTVEELAALVKSRLDPKKGALFHGAGSALKGDLAVLLAPDGYEVRRSVLYDATPASALSGATVTALRDGRIDMVLLFSPRTAETFVALARSAGVDGACGAIVALCLSPPVAEAAKAVRWRAVRVASRPERSALLDLLDAPIDMADTQPGSAAGEDILAPARNGDEKESAALGMIRAFGGIRPMASKLGVPVTTVQGWKERGHIPAARIGDLRAAAAIHGINLDALDLAGATAGSGETAPTAAPIAADVPPPGTASPAPSVPPKAAAPVDPVRQAPSSAVPPGNPRANETLKAGTPPDQKQANDKAVAPAPRRRRVGLAVALGALALAGLVLAGAVTLPYWGPDLGIAAPFGTSSSAGDDVPSLQERLAALEHSVATLNRPSLTSPTANNGSAGANASALADLETEITALKDENAKLAADAASLHQQLSALAQQSQADSAAEAQRSALVLAVGQLEVALSRSDPYDRELADVAALGQGDGAVADAVAALKPRATLGIPTLAQLTARYEATSVAAARAAIAAPRPGLLGAVIARLETLVVIRRTDGAGARGTDAALARGAAFLKTGDLADAVTELGTLEGEPAHAMAPWLNDALARLTAESALGTLSSRAIARLGAGRS